MKPTDLSKVFKFSNSRPMQFSYSNAIQSPAVKSENRQDSYIAQRRNIPYTISKSNGDVAVRCLAQVGQGHKFGTSYSLCGLQQPHEMVDWFFFS